MKYQVTIYFLGPKTCFDGRVDPDDVIGVYRYRWLWTARWAAKSVMLNLNSLRCGYAISRGDEIIQNFQQQEL